MTVVRLKNKKCVKLQAHLRSTWNNDNALEICESNSLLGISLTLLFNYSICIIVELYLLDINA